MQLKLAYKNDMSLLLCITANHSAGKSVVFTVPESSRPDANRKYGAAYFCDLDFVH